MRYAILADIHANLEALQVVLDDIKKQNCERIVCLGDLVGYNASPKECIEIVRAMDIPCVMGNHDAYCAKSTSMEGFNLASAKAILWTRRQLTENDLKWLQRLEYVRRIESFTMVHATLDGPERWGYVFDKLAATASFAHQKTDVCFFGHTHVPLVFVSDPVVRGSTYSKFKVEPEKRYFVNVGSVGQPRDNNPKAAYVVYDLDKKTIELRRLDYDIAGAQKRIRDADLPGH